MKKSKLFYEKNFRSRGKYAFLDILNYGSSILDVGCGNDASYNIKTCYPSLKYTGIDIGNYNQTKPMLADEFILTSPEEFSKSISSFHNHFDAVISSHNLEHCNHREETLIAMANAVKPGGLIYLSFPCEASIGFPSRSRTLNYFDDPTHKGLPPNFDLVIQTLIEKGFNIQFSTRRYRPCFLSILGFIQEPFAYIGNNILQGTWALYGFESIIWAKKNN